LSKTYRLGAIGFAKGHINGLLDSFADLPNVEWVACADTVPAVPSKTAKPGTRKANLERARTVTGIPKVYDDYRDMLDRERFDIVVFCPENARHGEVAEAIAAAGAHMLTEKPMAASLSDALRMVRAARANSVSLMVNWPTAWRPAIRTMKTLIDEGTIGEVWEFKYRNPASTGPRSTGPQAWTNDERAAEWWYQTKQGGGALLDYCCYGACLARWLLGTQAVAAMGLRINAANQYADADDNGMIAVRFPHAVAILEGTWSTWNVGVPTGPIAYGTRGTLVVTGRARADGGRPVQRLEVYTTRSVWPTEPDQILEGEPLPEGQDTPSKAFIHHLETGEPLHPLLNMAQNLEVMAILDAGIRSASSGKMEWVNDATWCIG
jgi:predicted dehydrogenase